jgi:hexosaminidase
MAEPAPVDPSRLLCPRPQRLRWLGGTWRLPVRLTWQARPDVQLGPALHWLELALESRGHRLERALDAAGAGAEFRFGLDPFEWDADVSVDPRPAAPIPSHAARSGYTLSITAGGASMAFGTAAGLHYALCTLVQLVTLGGTGSGRLELGYLAIEDWPDFQARGVMLDVSRDKVPTLGSLYSLIDRLARWKVSQFQLYMEHTFAYAGHEVVWQHASPFTAEEIRALDAYAAARHIELVPNQNSFGHMQRWLVHEPYRALAECPEGFEHPWNWSGEPYGLCATDPRSLVFLEGLYDQLLPNFSSRMFNVGLDETLDLGCGRSRAACEARGTERVYLDFLSEVHARVQARGSVMQFWGDIIVKRPDLIAELPRDAIALEWGYEADHPFAEHLALFDKAGLGFYVCPGTSSWCSIAGRTENAILNLARAAQQGKAWGAAGLLITDWGDHGHLQPSCISDLGLLVGAAFSWNVSDAERPLELDVPAWLDAHVFFDAAAVLGRVAYDLGNAYREAGSLRANASVLFWSLIKPERLFSPPGVTRETLERTLAYIERVSAPLALARPQGTEGPIVLLELAWARDLLRFACRLGLARCTLDNPDDLSQLPAGPRAQLALDLGELVERHRSSWLARNRPGGLDDSAGRLTQLMDALRS